LITHIQYSPLPQEQTKKDATDLESAASLPSAIAIYVQMITLSLQLVNNQSAKKFAKNLPQSRSGKKARSPAFF